MGQRRVMNEFGRLGAGVLLLGLAIFLATSLDRQPADHAMESGSADLPDTTAKDSSPAWQAPSRDQATAPALSPGNDQIAKPVFPPPPGTLTRDPRNSSLISSRSAANLQLGQVPRLDDRYRAGAPLQVTGTIQQDHSLVPVQPKPGFTGKLLFAGGTHRVRPGDTLQSIASEYYGSADRYLDIYLANKHVLSNPARLPEGVELRLPE